MVLIAFLQKQIQQPQILSMHRQKMTHLNNCLCKSYIF